MYLFINLLVISPKECTRVLIQQPDMCGTSNITVVEMRWLKTLKFKECIQDDWPNLVSVRVQKATRFSRLDSESISSLQLNMAQEKKGEDQL